MQKRATNYRVSEKNRYTWFFFACLFIFNYFTKPTYWIPHSDPLKGIHTQKYIYYLAIILNYDLFKKATKKISCGPYFGIFGMPNVPNPIFWHCESIEQANTFQREKRNLKSNNALKSYSSFKVTTSPSSAAKSDFLHNTNRTKKNERISKIGSNSVIYWPN